MGLFTDSSFLPLSAEALSNFPTKLSTTCLVISIFNMPKCSTEKQTNDSNVENGFAIHHVCVFSEIFCNDLSFFFFFFSSF